jgi:MerR family transcriptional regulator, light-induced transcriptional regulator
MKAQAAVSTHVKPSDPVELSIGTLSSATGVPVDTLRTWERRYGFPAPIARTEGSHRRYSADTIATVQLVVRALELGHRPSAVVGRDPEELRRLLGPARKAAPAPLAASVSSLPPMLERWLGLTLQLDGEGLTSEFHRGLAEMAAIDFLERCMGPYLTEVGERWAQGQLRISHEHFATERAREFLSEQWRRLAERSRDPERVSVILATPPGEHHVLGLHMAAWVIARADAHVVFLGADTPMAEVAFAVERHAAQGVALSVADGYGGDLRRYLADLVSRLPPGVSVALGGAGSVEVGGSVHRMNGFYELLNWAERVQHVSKNLDTSAFGRA